jgi:hypothetical protein
MKMLFDADCGTYEYSSVKMWQVLESTKYATLFRSTMKRAPEIADARKKWKLRQKEKLQQVEKEKALVRLKQGFRRVKVGRGVLGNMGEEMAEENMMVNSEIEGRNTVCAGDL